MRHPLTVARSVALLYAVVVGLFQFLNVMAIATQSPDEWRKVVGHAAIGIGAALLPLAALTIGHRFAARETSQRILSAGVIVACVLPFVVAVLLSFSAEPLAMLALLFVPPAQALLLVAVLAVTAFAKRA